MAKKLGTDLEKGIKSDSMASRQEHFGYTYVAPPPPESIFGAPPLVYASGETVGRVRGACQLGTRDCPRCRRRQRRARLDQTDVSHSSRKLSATTATPLASA